jgi:hypothetical protein
VANTGGIIKNQASLFYLSRSRSGEFFMVKIPFAACGRSRAIVSFISGSMAHSIVE